MLDKKDNLMKSFFFSLTVRRDVNHGEKALVCGANQETGFLYFPFLFSWDPSLGDGAVHIQG